MNREIAGVLAMLLVSIVAQSAAGDTVKVSGRVMDEEGRPLSEARVELRWFSDERRDRPEPTIDTTDQQGRFSFALDEDAKIEAVTAGKDGYSIDWKSPVLSPDEPITLRLGPPAGFSGRVVDETGQPFEGAAVALILSRPGKAGLPLGQIGGSSPQTRTDAEGRFAFENLPENAGVGFSVSADGRALSATDAIFESTPFRPSQEGIRIVLHPEARLHGKVVRASDGEPLSGVEVCAGGVVGWGQFANAQVETDEDGRFELGGLSGGTCEVSITGPGDPPEWLGSVEDVQLTPGRTTGPVTIEASRGGLLEVSLTPEQEDRPLGDCRGMVILVPAKAGAHDWHIGRFDGEPTATMRLAAGTYRIEMLNVTGVSVTETPTERVSIKAGATTRLEVKARPDTPITGEVVDAAGNPVPGAEVYPLHLMDPQPQPIISDDQGRFTVQLEELTGGLFRDLLILLVIDREGDRAALQEHSDQLRITLRRAGRVRGRVTDGEDKPLSDALVRVEIVAPHVGTFWEGEWTSTDAEGRYQIGLLPDVSYVIVATAPGHGRSETRVSVQRMMTAPVPTMALSPVDRSVTGLVRGPDGSPLPGAIVRADGEDQPRPYPATMTDRNGRFELTGLAPGRLNLRASVPGLGMRGWESVSDEDDDVIIRTRPADRY